MIRSFADKDALGLFHGRYARRHPGDIQRTSQRTLRQIHAAEILDDSRAPPGNHLEALERDWHGQHGIRINDQWRVCFVWTDGGTGALRESGNGESQAVIRALVDARTAIYKRRR